MMRIKSTYLIFFVTLLSGFLWLVSVWPGYTQFDSFVFISESRRGFLMGWLTFSLSFLTKFADLFPNPVVVILIIFLSSFSVVIAFYYVGLQRIHPSRWWWVYIIFIILNPLVLSMTVFFSRESIFAILNVYLFLQLYFWKYDKTSVMKYSGLIFWTLSLGIFCELRQDAKIYLLIYPILALVTGILDKKKTIFVMIGAIGINALILNLGKAVYKAETPFQTKYLLTSTFPVLYSYERQLPDVRFTSEDLKDIQPVIALDAVDFRNARDPYSYLLGKITRASDKEVEVYLKRIRILILRNFKGLLQHRLRHFSRSLNITNDYTEWFSDALRGKGSNEVKLLAAGLGISRKETVLTPWVYWLNDNFIYNFFWKKIFFNGLFALIISFVAVFLYKLMPLTAGISVIFLSKYLIIFLFAPLDFANYSYICYLGMLILLPLMFLEREINKRVSCDKGVYF